MKLQIENGLLCCHFGSYGIANLTAKLLYRGDHYNTLEISSNAWSLSQHGNVAKAQTTQGEFTLKAKKSSGGVCLSLAFKTNGDFKTRKGSRLVICGKLPCRPQKLQFNAPQVEDWIHNFEMNSISKGMALIENQREECAQYCAFKAKGNVYGVVGFTTFKNYFVEIGINESGALECYSNLDLCEIRANQVIKTDECFIYFKRGDTDVLTRYGKQIALANAVKELTELPTGWCSWYYYGPNISQEIILENVLTAKSQNLPIKYIQIDDGWQKDYGDWTENDKFSNGMKALADKIKEQGYIPGIWFSPFLFSTKSQTFKDHPEFFVPNEKGEFSEKLYVDYSVKGARKWLFDLAKKLSVEWGFRYIKIDLITFRLAPKGYKGRNFNGIKNFRQAIKTMRSAVTPDTVFLTCTSPVGASAGISQCVRVSDDIFERWNSLKAVAKQVFRRYFVSEYINLDPDCLMVRTHDKHDEQAFRLCVRDEKEIQTFINFISASGGAIMLSDKLTLLDNKDFDKIKTLFPINTRPAKPLDIFERDVPSILYYGNRNGLDMYALFNWTNEVDTLTIDLKQEKFVKTFYSKQTTKTSKYSITLEPHASEIIYVAEAERDFGVLCSSIMPK